jgi:hypothetical protein
MKKADISARLANIMKSCIYLCSFSAADVRSPACPVDGKAACSRRYKSMGRKPNRLPANVAEFQAAKCRSNDCERPV